MGTKVTAWLLDMVGAAVVAFIFARPCHSGRQEPLVQEVPGALDWAPSPEAVKYHWEAPGGERSRRRHRYSRLSPCVPHLCLLSFPCHRRAANTTISAHSGALLTNIARVGRRSACSFGANFE
ncbi:hypothetical protein C8F01DRAFT_267707 [Mycena amicta]|nr:hypothetical protein C8F01DRAFT_267707 [Mycena amicta]